MMKIIALVLQLVFVAGGVALGLSFKSSQSAESEDKQEESEGGEKTSKEKQKEKDKKKKPKKDKSKGKKGKKSKDGKDDSKGGDSTYGFLKFSRQFIVPIVVSDRVDTLLIIDINLEVKPSATESAYSQEPKLRDALLTALLRLSNQGAFDDKMLEEENLDVVREQLLHAAKSVIGDDVLEVLILSMARQEL